MIVDLNTKDFFNNVSMCIGVDNALYFYTKKETLFKVYLHEKMCIVFNVFIENVSYETVFEFVKSQLSGLGVKISKIKYSTNSYRND